jgi:hypothetical protein
MTPRMRRANGVLGGRHLCGVMIGLTSGWALAQGAELSPATSGGSCTNDQDCAGGMSCHGGNCRLPSDDELFGSPAERRCGASRCVGDEVCFEHACLRPKDAERRASERWREEDRLAAEPRPSQAPLTGWLGGLGVALAPCSAAATATPSSGASLVVPGAVSVRGTLERSTDFGWPLFFSALVGISPWRSGGPDGPESLPTTIQSYCGVVSASAGVRIPLTSDTGSVRLSLIPALVLDGSYSSNSGFDYRLDGSVLGGWNYRSGSLAAGLDLGVALDFRMTSGRAIRLTVSPIRPAIWYYTSSPSGPSASGPLSGTFATLWVSAMPSIELRAAF